MECEAFTIVSYLIVTEKSHHVACILGSQIPLYSFFLYFLLLANKLHIILQHYKHILNKYLKNFKLILTALQNANLLYLMYRKLLFLF